VGAAVLRERESKGRVATGDGHGEGAEQPTRTEYRRKVVHRQQIGACPAYRRALEHLPRPHSCQEAPSKWEPCNRSFVLAVVGRSRGLRAARPSVHQRRRRWALRFHERRRARMYRRGRARRHTRLHTVTCTSCLVETGAGYVTESMALARAAVLAWTELGGVTACEEDAMLSCEFRRTLHRPAPICERARWRSAAAQPSSYSRVGKPFSQFGLIGLSHEPRATRTHTILLEGLRVLSPKGCQRGRRPDRSASRA
jgi:hypothetical protein